MAVLLFAAVPLFYMTQALLLLGWKFALAAWLSPAGAFALALGLDLLRTRIRALPAIPRLSRQS